MKPIAQFLRTWWLPVVLFIAFIGLWQALVTLFKIHPVVLPSPWAVWQAGY
jgi:ABC-type nitrate/sulfonate/bicarbonate transport system permease component